MITKVLGPTGTNRSASRTGWSGLQVSLMNQEDQQGTLCDAITLDNGSTMSLFSNSELVENIVDDGSRLILRTNAGQKECNTKATVPGFGTVWFDKEAIANIFGFADLVEKHRITYDSDQEDAFLVHMPNKIIKFKQNGEGLYQYKTTPKYKQDLVKTMARTGESHVIASVKENSIGHTKRQLERAKLARKLYHIMGAPTVDAFKAMLRGNMIKNCPVTSQDVKLAEEIYGPAISTLKGKSTRRTPKPVVVDEIEIPPELLSKHRQIELCMDTMFINSQPFLTAIDKTIRFRSLIPITSRKGPEYVRALRTLVQHYNKGGFMVGLIHCDGEYKSIIAPVKDQLQAEMNFANPGDHVPEAERNNRTIKERLRATFHRLPYKAMPRVMIRYLAMDNTAKLNMFPAKGGISPYYSPSILLGQRTLDYNKECTVPFGTYYQTVKMPWILRIRIDDDASVLLSCCHHLPPSTHQPHIPSLVKAHTKTE